MSIKHLTPPPSLHEMRDAGRLISDKALIEMNLDTGTLTWANDFALAKLGYTIEQFRTITIFELVPEDFHEQVRDNIAEQSAGNVSKFSLWPSVATNGRIVWWFAYQNKVEYPISWSFAECVQETDSEGALFVFMRMQMQTTNNYGNLNARVNELDSWVHQQVERLDEKDANLERTITELQGKMQQAVAAASRAASTSLEAVAAFKDLRESIKQQLSQHEEEIVKLIGTDVLHDRRMEAFEKHVQTTTTTAINSITTQADRAGKGLSRRIIVPVSAIAVIAQFLQWFIAHVLGK